MTYEVEIHEDKTLLLIKRANFSQYSVLRIVNPGLFEGFLCNDDSLLLDVFYRKDSHHLISLEFKMSILKSQFEALISGDKKERDEKIINFYHKTVEAMDGLKDLFSK